MLQRLARAARWLCGGLALLMGAELTAWVALRALTHRTESRPDPRYALPQFREYPWAERYWTENSVVRLGFEYHAWVGQRRSPFAGETINVDEAGFRKTHHSRCGGDSPEVWLFGGSTLWGYGAPDELTIPSLLARRLEAAGHPACVVNYGELGRTSTTEVVELLLALKRAPRAPEVVIFYDGCNDVLKLWSDERHGPGTRNRVDAELLELHREASRGDFGYLELSNLSMLLQRLAARLGITTAGDLETPIAELAGRLAADYLGNVELATALAASSGAASLFLLQPVVYTGHKPLHAAELSRLEATVSGPAPQLEQLFDASYAQIRAHAPRSVVDLSGLLDERPEAMYFDVCHVTPAVNELVAAAVAPVVSDALRRARSVAAEGTRD